MPSSKNPDDPACNLRMSPGAFGAVQAQPKQRDSSQALGISTAMETVVFVVLQAQRVHGEFVRAVCATRERAEEFVVDQTREGIRLHVIEEVLLR